MKNGWTGGQYSLYRLIFGLYLFIHFLHLMPWSGELFSNQGMIADGSLSPLLHLFPNLLALNDSLATITVLNVCGLAASVFFMVGKWDRLAALILWYVLACFFGRNPLIANPSLPFVGWLLLAHLFVPTAPYGSLAAKDRLDPSGSWRLSPALFFSAWTVLSIAYTYSGILKLNSPSWVDGSAFSYLLQNPLIRLNILRELLLTLPPFLLQIMTWGVLALEISFAGLALFKKIRPWLWTAMVLMHVGLLCLIQFADLTWGMMIVHFFTFDPAWVKPRPIAGKLTVLYDGTCGFCHSFIRFILSENKTRAPFRFAPQESASSTIIVKEQDRTLVKSEAVFRVLVSLGGIWKVFGVVFSFFPKFLCDGVYDLVARIRHRLFAKPKEACPIIPPEMREFFYPD